MRWRYFGQSLEPIIPIQDALAMKNDLLANSNQVDEFLSDDSDGSSSKNLDSELANFKIKTPDKRFGTPTSQSELRIRLVKLSSYRPVKSKLPKEDQKPVKKSPNVTTSVKKKLLLNSIK